MSITINILQEDALSCNQLKRERFRTSIRKNNLENIFRQNRMIHKLGDKTGVIGTLESLQRFLKTNNPEDYDQFCNLLDSMDFFDAYKQVGDSILDIKAYLIQPLNKNLIEFQKLFRLVSNCILVNSNMINQLLQNEEGNFDPNLIFQLIRILSSDEWKSLHTIALDVLNLLLERESQVFELLSLEKGLIENLIHWGYDQGEKQYLMNLAEFISLYMAKCKKIKFQNQVDITIALLEKAKYYNEIQFSYGTILLALQLEGYEFQYAYGLVQELLDQIMHSFLSQECSFYDYLAIFKILRKSFKQVPEFLLILMVNLNPEIITDRIQKIDKRASKEFLKLIGRCYEALQCFLQDSNSHEIDIGSLTLISNLEKFLDLILDFQISPLRKMKPVVRLVRCLKYLHFQMGVVKQLTPDQMIKYLDIFITALDEKQYTADSKLYTLEYLTDLVLFQDIQFQNDFTNMIPEKLREQLLQLSYDENQQIVQETENLRYFICF